MANDPAKHTKKAKKPTIPVSSESWAVHDVAGMSPENISELAMSGGGLKIRKPKKTAPKTPPKAKAKQKATTKPKGRPSKFTQELADEIVHRISTGEPLRQICRDPHMPGWRTIYDWQDADKAFSARIAHARELGEEAIAQECLDIADDAQNDWMEKHGRDGNEFYVINGEHVQRSKLRIETRLKLLAKWNPRKWGEKVDLNHGVQPDNPLMSVIQRVAGTGLPIVKDKAE